MYRDISLDAEEYQVVLNNLTEAGKDLEPWFKAIGEHLVGSHRERWSEEKDSQGHDWVDLKPATWAKKKGSKKLFETKTMLGTRGASYDANSNQLLFGLADDKAGWHHFGTQNRSGAEIIPARELIGISTEDGEEIVALGVDHLESATK